MVFIPILLLALVSCGSEPSPTPIITPLPTKRVRDDVTASGTVVTAQEAQLSFAMLGRVAEMQVAVGDVVTEGQPLVHLDAAELEASLARAEAALVVAQRERARLDAPPDADAVAAAEAGVRAAAAAVTRTLVARNAPALSELDVAHVRPGQLATLFVEGLDNLQIPGGVQRIARRPELLGGDVVYAVIVDLDEVPPELRLGMSVEVTIDVE